MEDHVCSLTLERHKLFSMNLKSPVFQLTGDAPNLATIQRGHLQTYWDIESSQCNAGEE